MEILSTGLLWYAVFLFSLISHEFAHSMIAFKLGDDTADSGGQYTLNPIPHIRREPIGTVLVPIISYLLSGWMMGWASAPYDQQWAFNNPKRLSVMSLAGPLSNLLLVILSAVAIYTGIFLGVFEAPDSITFTHTVVATQTGIFVALAKFISIMFSLNLILFIFNLLPLPPLDGSGVIPLFMSEEKARNYMMWLKNSNMAFLGIILAWRVMDFIFEPLYILILNILYPGAGYGL